MKSQLKVGWEINKMMIELKKIRNCKMECVLKTLKTTKEGKTMMHAQNLKKLLSSLRAFLTNSKNNDSNYHNNKLI